MQTRFYKSKLLIFIFLFHFGVKGYAQTVLLGPEAFDSDVVVHGTTAPTNVWFAPEYYAPIDYATLWGCSGGYVGYQNSYNNYWMNFLRTPEVDCTGNDSVTLSFDMSNSYSSSHPNDKVYFNMWIDGAYHDASVNQTIFFDDARNCVHFDVVFNLTPYTDKHVLFYLNTYCGYNDSEMYLVKFDNISVVSPLSTAANDNQSPSENVNVFPNPSQNFTTIQFPNPDNKILTLYIYNAMGQEVQKMGHISGTEVSLDNKNRPQGMYFFQLKNVNESVGNGTFTIMPM